ncbi:MAG: hypothetical protein WC796_03565 [Candidatus Pacearchaeota archaeon]|jgi:hypothetical protein
MDREFEDSQALKQLIECNGWTLYDTTSFIATGIRPEFEDLERQGPAQTYVFGGNYFFTPIPQNGQSLREAYAVTKGLGPCLLIEDPDHPRWRSLDVKPKQKGNYFLGRAPDTGTFAIFSRLSFDIIGKEDCVIAWTPESAYPNPDHVFIRADMALDTFIKYFRVLQLQIPEGN